MTIVDQPLTNIFPPASEEDWRKRVELVLKGASFHKKLVHHTYDHLTVGPLYSRKPWAGLVAGAGAGRPWRVMARMDHPVAEEAAKLAIADLEGGADALVLVFAGSRSARDYGLSCVTVADLETALEDVQLDLISMRLDCAATDTNPVQFVASLVKRQKLDPQQLRIDFGMDPVSRACFASESEAALAIKQACDVVLLLMKKGFKGPFLTIDLRNYHEAGASEGQELGAALAHGVLYLRALETSGLTLEAARQCLSFTMPLDADQFLGMAKVRALRQLWQQVELACGLVPKPMVINAETSWRMMTKRDSYVNILRATIATFAAGVGGADSVTVLPFTQALGLPEAQARRLARNTSIVLQEESALWRVVDPAAGAGGFETVTNELAAKAWALFQQIELEGGLVASLVAGKLQERINQTSEARLRAVATRKDPLTGMSEFANIAETVPLVFDSVNPFNASFKTPVEYFVSRRTSEPFERLRDRADAHLAAMGERPNVTLLTLGALPVHTARLSFMRNVFEAGGFDVVVSASSSSDGTFFCIVGSDMAYAENATDVAKTLVALGKIVWLAGKPGALEPALTAAGIKRFVFAGSDMVEVLDAAHDMFARSSESKSELVEVAR